MTDTPTPTLTAPGPGCPAACGHALCSVCALRLPGSCRGSVACPAGGARHRCGGDPL